MRYLKIQISALALLLSVVSFGLEPEKYVSSKTHIKFFSSTPVEDIEAHNYAAVSTIKPEDGTVVFSVPMQSFEFEKALMQKHFNNENFLETKVYPKAKLVGKITNLSEINFGKDGVYKAEIEGKLTIKDKTNMVNETGTITVKGDAITVNSKFKVTLSSYGVSFDEKEKVSKKISKDVEVTVVAEYMAK